MTIWILLTQKFWFSFTSASMCLQLIAIVSSWIRLWGNVFTYFRADTDGLRRTNRWNGFSCSHLQWHTYLHYTVHTTNIWSRAMSSYYLSDVNTGMRLCGNEFVYSLCVLCGSSTQHTEYKDEKYPFHINSKYGSINKHQQSILLFSDQSIEWFRTLWACFFIVHAYYSLWQRLSIFLHWIWQPKFPLYYAYTTHKLRVSNIQTYKVFIL